MDANNEIRLRLRFYKDVSEDINVVRQKFEDFKNKSVDKYSIKVNDNHIWLHIIGTDKHYFSPHLHIELEEHNEKGTHIRGLFGPDATLWTLFIFLHFVVAGIFIIFSMIAYSNFTMNQSMIMDFSIMFIMVIVWFLLYIIAKQIRYQGNNQMNELERLFENVIK